MSSSESSADCLIPDWQAPARVHARVTTRQCSLQFVEPVLPEPPQFLHQVHGTEVVDLDRRPDPLSEPEGDAAVTRRTGQVVAIRTADCLPVLFCHRTDAVIAGAHAGWRGLAAGVLEQTVKAMDAAPDGIMAWLGPAIGQQAFEVGPEVRDRFLGHHPEAVSAFTRGQGDRWHADIYTLARQRLSDAGVTQVSGGGFCTYTESERFFSYRRNPDCGRMVSLVWMGADE